MDKQIYSMLTSIATKIVKATELSFSSTKLLQDAQLELADLYKKLNCAGHQHRPEN